MSGCQLICGEHVLLTVQPCNVPSSKSDTQIAQSRSSATLQLGGGDFRHAPVVAGHAVEPAGVVHDRGIAARAHLADDAGDDAAHFLVALGQPVEQA